MHSLIWIIIALYTVGMVFIFAYSLVQLNLLLNYRKSKRSKLPQLQIDKLYPRVLIQLPVFNELYVVERLIDATAQLNYPADKLEIQVLDDSTDESVEVAAKRIAYWKTMGVNIQHVRRSDRTGFKAGALQYGLELSDAPFIAIFDADFIPGTEFLNQTIPQFTHDNIGMVQSRWEHLNREYSLLTQVQAFALDAHFTV